MQDLEKQLDAAFEEIKKLDAALFNLADAIRLELLRLKRFYIAHIAPYRNETLTESKKMEKETYKAVTDALTLLEQEQEQMRDGKREELISRLKTALNRETIVLNRENPVDILKS